MKWIVSALFCLLFSCLPLSVGCLMMDPGGQTKKALTQQNIFGWGADGEFSANTLGTHEAGFAMYEGYLVFVVNADGTLMVDEAGNPVIDPLKSNITAALIVSPKADVAGAALVAMAQASIEQAEIFKSGFIDLVDRITPLIGTGGSVIDTQSNDSAMTDEVVAGIRANALAALEAALRDIGAPPATPPPE